MIKKDHKGLYLCEPNNHGIQTDIRKMEGIDWSEQKYPPTVVLKAVGDIVEGEVLEIGEVTLSDRIAGYMQIGTKDGRRTFWLGKVLSEEVVKTSLKVGDFVGIKYLGEKPSAKGNPYKDYDMRIIPAVRGEVEG